MADVSKVYKLYRFQVMSPCDIVEACHVLHIYSAVRAAAHERDRDSAHIIFPLILWHRMRSFQEIHWKIALLHCSTSLQICESVSVQICIVTTLTQNVKENENSIASQLIWIRQQQYEKWIKPPLLLSTETIFKSIILQPDSTDLLFVKPAQEWKDSVLINSCEEFPPTLSCFSYEWNAHITQ